MTDLLEQSPTLGALYEGIAPLNMNAGWALATPSLWAAPRQNFLPARWSYADSRAALSAAGRLVDTELAERRNMILFNPVGTNAYGTVRTLVCAYQSVMPGEVTRSHRHTPNALRFVLEGRGAYTVVDGERLEMRPNDVLLTPNWCWHGHHSEADGPCFWLDCLDVPLVQLLEPMFFEPHPNGEEPVAKTPERSPFIFRWEDTQAALDKASPDPTGRYGTRVQLGNPAMVTIGLHMERLDGGTRTRPFRTTANRIFCCAEGGGTTIIDGEAMPWSRGDVIAAPSWRTVSHHVESDATLFCMTDEPLMRSLGWLREEDQGDAA